VLETDRAAPTQFDESRNVKRRKVVKIDIRFFKKFS
jgi:hypothetical protein